MPHPAAAAELCVTSGAGVQPISRILSPRSLTLKCSCKAICSSGLPFPALHPCNPLHSFTDPGTMEGCWVGRVGWPIADNLSTEWSPVNHQSVKVCRPDIDVLTTEPRHLLATSVHSEYDYKYVGKKNQNRFVPSCSFCTYDCRGRRCTTPRQSRTSNTPIPSCTASVPPSSHCICHTQTAQPSILQSQV